MKNEKSVHSGDSVSCAWNIQMNVLKELTKEVFINIKIQIVFNKNHDPYSCLADRAWWINFCFFFSFPNDNKNRHEAYLPHSKTIIILSRPMDSQEEG